MQRVLRECEAAEEDAVASSSAPRAWRNRPLTFFTLSALSGLFLQIVRVLPAPPIILP